MEKRIMAIWEPGISRPIEKNWNPKADPVEAAADILSDIGSMKGSDIYKSVVNAEQVINKDGRGISPTSDLADGFQARLEQVSGGFAPRDTKKRQLREIMQQIGEAFPKASYEDKLALIVMLKYTLQNTPGALRGLD